MAAEWMYAAPLHSPSISSSWEGVDRNDQLRQYYSVPTKCRKYYKYIFWFLFEVAITNSHILHSNYSTAPRLSLKEYRLELAKGLVGDFHSKKRHNRQNAANITSIFFGSCSRLPSPTPTSSIRITPPLHDCHSRSIG